MATQLFGAKTIVAVLCLSLFPIGCGKKKVPLTASTVTSETVVTSPDADRGESTPEAAFEKFQSAAAANDTDSMLDALTEDSLSTVAGGLVFTASFVSAVDPAKGKEIEALMKKHKIDAKNDQPDNDQPPAQTGGVFTMIGNGIEDKRAFIAEIGRLLQEDGNQDGFMALGAATLGEISIDGDKATAMMTTTEGLEPIGFRRTGKRWLVDITEPGEAMEMSVGSDMSFAPSAEFDRFGSDPNEEAVLPPSDAVTQEQFDHWQSDFDIETTAAEALQQLSSRCGMEISNANRFADPLSKKVNVHLKNVSPLRAIEEVCSQIGIHPQYQATQLAFDDGPRPLPVVFAGPFLIQVTDVGEYVPYAVGHVGLRFVATGLPVSAIARLKELTGWNLDNEGEALVQWNEAIGSNGKNVLHSRTNAMPSSSSASEKTIVFSQTVSLRNLVRDVESITHVTGNVSFSVPSEIDKVKIDPLEEGSSATSDEAKLTLSRLNLDDENSMVTIKYQDIDSDRLTLIARDKEGKLLKINGTGGSSNAEGGEVSTFLGGRPDSMEIWIVRATRGMKFPFTIPSIPLKSFDQMPEVIEPLKFDGEAPLTIRFDSITGSDKNKKIKIEVTNESNRDVQAITMRIEYLDGAGKVLDHSPHTHSGNRRMAPVGETIPLSISAFFMPDNAKSCRVAATHVWFADHSEWVARVD